MLRIPRKELAGWGVLLVEKATYNLTSPGLRAYFLSFPSTPLGFPGGANGKESVCQCRRHKRDSGSISVLERSPGERNDNPLQYSCLENSMGRGALWAQSMGLQRVGQNWKTGPPPPPSSPQNSWVQVQTSWYLVLNFTPITTLPHLRPRQGPCYTSNRDWGGFIREWSWVMSSSIIIIQIILYIIYTIYMHIRSDQISQSCPTLCDPMNRSMPGLPVHHQFPEFTETHVHRVGDAIQPSHLLSSPSPPAPNPSQHQSLFQWVNSSHKVARVLEFQL